MALPPCFQKQSTAAKPAARSQSSWAASGAIPALCASAVVLIVARLAARLGGGGFAQILAAVGMAAVAVVQAITGFFSMNALDIVFWAAAWLVLAEWLVRKEPRTVLGPPA